MTIACPRSPALRPGWLGPIGKCSKPPNRDRPTRVPCEAQPQAMAIIQNTLYLTTPGTVVLRDHLTLPDRDRKGDPLDRAHPSPGRHLRLWTGRGDPAGHGLVLEASGGGPLSYRERLSAGSGLGKRRLPLPAAPGPSMRPPTVRRRHHASPGNWWPESCRTRVPTSCGLLGKPMTNRVATGWRERLPIWPG